AAFDLIVTAFHLDCFLANEVDELITRLTPSLRPAGCWYVVDFAIPRKTWKRTWAWVWANIMIRLFRLQTGLQSNEIIDLRRAFAESGWQTLAEFESSSGFQFASVFKMPASGEVTPATPVQNLGL